MQGWVTPGEPRPPPAPASAEPFNVRRGLLSFVLAPTLVLEWFQGWRYEGFPKKKVPFLGVPLRMVIGRNCGLYCDSHVYGN